MRIDTLNFERFQEVRGEIYGILHDVHAFLHPRVIVNFRPHDHLQNYHELGRFGSERRVGDEFRAKLWCVVECKESLQVCGGVEHVLLFSPNLDVREESVTENNAWSLMLALWDT